MEKDVKYLADLISKLNATDALKALSSLTQHKAVFSSSLGLEDMVLTNIIFSENLNIDVFTLDTGRLFPETYSLLSAIQNKNHNKIKVFYPQHSSLQHFVEQKGINAFYDSIDNRLTCCNIRKVEPLKRALSGYTVWLTGIRASQSGNRVNMPMVEWDDVNEIIKIHPILNWTLEDTQNYLKQNNVAYNPLHDRGFVSIGCQPCTRAVQAGEDFRAGRWWWEDTSKKECGLHVTKNELIN
jgi:phosphoadenosine phosphosulfate reductase